MVTYRSLDNLIYRPRDICGLQITGDLQDVEYRLLDTGDLQAMGYQATGNLPKSQPSSPLMYTSLSNLKSMMTVNMNEANTRRTHMATEYTMSKNRTK